MAAENPFAEIVNISMLEVYLVNEQTLHFEYANTAAISNIGYSAGELNKLRVTDVFRFPDEMALRALLNALQHSSGDKLTLQLKFMRENGTHYDADVQIQRLSKDHRL